MECKHYGKKKQMAFKWRRKETGVSLIAGGYVRISVEYKNVQSSIQSQEMIIQEFIKEQPEIILVQDL